MKKSLMIWLINMIVFLFAVMPLYAQDDKETDDEVDLELEELFNVKVSVASKKAENISDAPGVIYVVSQDELQRSGAITLREVLMRVPSMGIATTALTSRSLPVMRGDMIKINSGHLLFLLNGRPVREVQEGGVNSDFIESFPVDAIEQIEVIRGPGSVLYGSDAFSGVINISTKHPVDGPGTFAVTGNYEVPAGGGGSGNVMYKNGDLEVTAAGRYYRKPDWYPGVVKRVAVQKSIIPPIFTTVDSIFDTTKIVDYGPGVFLDMKFKGLSGMFSFVQWTSGAFQVPNEVARQHKLFGNVGYESEILDNWNTEINITGSQTGFLADEPSFTRRKSNNLLLENTHFITLFENMNLVGGGTVSYIDGLEENLQDADPYTVSEGDRLAFSGYIQADYTFFNFVKFIAGAQGNKTREINAHIAPRIGTIWFLTDQLRLKALYSEAFRLPSINELFMNYDIGLYGDKNLKPEIVKTLDVGFTYQNDRMMLGINSFYSEQEDIIQQTLMYVDSTARRYKNLEGVTFTGIELTGKYYWNKELYINGSFMYQNNFQEDSTGKRHVNIVPFANLIVKGGISYIHPKGITLSIFNTYQGKLHKRFKGTFNNSDFSELDHIDNGPFHMLGLSSKFDLEKLLNLTLLVQPSVLFKVDNIIGKEVYMYEYGGYSNDLIPALRGREFYLGINVTM